MPMATSEYNPLPILDLHLAGPFVEISARQMMPIDGHVGPGFLFTGPATAWARSPGQVVPTLQGRARSTV